MAPVLFWLRDLQPKQRLPAENISRHSECSTLTATAASNTWRELQHLDRFRCLPVYSFHRWKQRCLLRRRCYLYSLQVKLHPASCCFGRGSGKQHFCCCGWDLWTRSIAQWRSLNWFIPVFGGLNNVARFFVPCGLTSATGSWEETLSNILIERSNVDIFVCGVWCLLLA